MDVLRQGMEMKEKRVRTSEKPAAPWTFKREREKKRDRQRQQRHNEYAVGSAGERA